MQKIKLLAVVAAMSTGLCLSITSFAAVHTYNSKTTASTTAIKDSKYLFVVSAGLKAAKVKGQYVLDLNLADVNQVITFSDRPQRVVKYITGADLKRIWSQGADSFKVDPPNAVLSSQNIAPIIVVLNSVKVNGNHIVYNFSSEKNYDA